MTFLPEDRAERAQFDRLVRQLYDGNPLRAIASDLATQSKVFPPEGSLAKVTAINANEVWKAAEELDRLRDLVRHCWLHSGYRNCGYQDMTTEQKALYEALTKSRPRSFSEPRKGL